MKRKTILIKMAFGFFGGIFIALGFLNLLILARILMGISLVLPQDLATIIILAVKTFFYLYLIIIGIGIYSERKWTTKGVMPLPIIFLVLEWLCRPDRTIGSFVIWLLFLCGAVLFLNSKMARSNFDKTTK